MVTPEDAILSKLEWATRRADSERQIRDAASIVELNPTLDRQYVTHWSEQLGVSDSVAGDLTRGMKLYF
jgi:hypothetical protein